MSVKYQHDYIEVEPEEFPYTEEIAIGGISKLWTFQWNEVGQFFHVDIAEMDGTSIYRGEPLIPYQQLWRGLNITGLPAERIMPLDETFQEQVLDPSTLNQTIRLAILDRPGDEELLNDGSA